MDEMELTADRLAPDSEGRIIRLNVMQPLRRRLLELGLIPGAVIRSRYTAPAGSPIAFEVGGALLALRRSDAEKIVVQEVGGLWTV